MGPLLVWGIVLGAGLILLLTAQPYGARKASMSERLAALRPGSIRVEKKPRQRVFSSRVFEDLARPLLEGVGAGLQAIGSRFGLGGESLERKLLAAGDVAGAPLFVGQKVASALIGFLLFPLGATVGVGPHLPAWTWLTMSAVGFFLPDLVLAGRIRSRRLALLEGLVQSAELLSLAVASGLAMEQAVDEMARGGSGVFFEELRSCLKEARVSGSGASAGRALGILSQRTGLPEIDSLLATVRLGEQGAPVTDALRAQARGIRQRRRLALLEAGERSQVRMVLPVGVFILPAFFLLVLYPAAVHLLQVARP